MSRPVRLTRRLVLEQRTGLPDGAGGLTTVWQPLGTLWAKVDQRSGREDFVAGQVLPRVRYRILVRGAPIGAASRPRPEQRLREGARVFDILTVSEHDPNGRYVEILAEEGAVS